MFELNVSPYYPRQVYFHLQLINGQIINDKSARDKSWNINAWLILFLAKKEEK
jgi:hypothetical protein